MPTALLLQTAFVKYYLPSTVAGSLTLCKQVNGVFGLGEGNCEDPPPPPPPLPGMSGSGSVLGGTERLPLAVPFTFRKND